MKSCAFAARAGRLQLRTGGVRLPEEEVFGNRPVEQVSVLGNDRYVVPHFAQGQVA